MLEITSLSIVVGGQCYCECKVPKGWVFVVRVARNEHCQPICENYARGHQCQLMDYHCIF